jgi:hypothetical protein
VHSKRFESHELHIPRPHCNPPPPRVPASQSPCCRASSRVLEGATAKQNLEFHRSSATHSIAAQASPITHAKFATNQDDRFGDSLYARVSLSDFSNQDCDATIRHSKSSLPSSSCNDRHLQDRNTYNYLPFMGREASHVRGKESGLTHSL